MYNKISDEKIRREKVSKLKEKILFEIGIKLSYIKKRIIKHTDDDSFDFYIKTGYALLKLKEYIENDNSFMSYVAKYSDENIIIYTIPDKNLDVWMQKDYFFVQRFLFKVEESDYIIDSMLTDKYFGSDFTNICDLILYENKKQEIDDLLEENNYWYEN